MKCQGTDEESGNCYGKILSGKIIYLQHNNLDGVFFVVLPYDTVISVIYRHCNDSVYGMGNHTKGKSDAKSQRNQGIVREKILSTKTLLFT